MPVPRPVVPFPAALLLLLALASSAQAQSDTTRLEDLVVTAARLEVPKRTVPVEVTVVTGAELTARGFRFVQDWLREVPGAMVVQSGSFGGVTSLFLRGGESDFTKVLVDGVPVNQPGGSIDLANLSTDAVERIEVARGPASVLYGSDAVTGVIQIFTRQGRGAGRLTALARGGSYGTSDLRAGYAGAGGRASWSLAGSRFGSGGTYPFNSGYRSWDASGRAGLRPDSASDLSLSVRYGDHQAHFPTDGTGTPVDSNQFTTERNLVLALEGGRRLGPALELRALASLFEGRQGFDDRPDAPSDTTGFAFAAIRDGRVTRRTVDLRANVRPAAAVTFTGGVEFSREAQQVSDRTMSNWGTGPENDTSSSDQSRRNAAAYAQALLGGPVFDVQAGVRVDDNQVFGRFATWRAGVVARPAGGIRFRLAAGSAFKQPTFSEQFANTPYEVGNPGLSPERAVSWEAGADGDLADGRLTASVTWFDQDFRNLIQYREAAPGEPTYMNVARARARGLEVGGSWAPLAAVTVKAQATLLSTRVEETGEAGPAFEPGKPLLRRPGRYWTAGILWRPSRGATVGIDFQRTGEREDVDYSAWPASRVTLAGYSLLNASADLPVTRGGSGSVTLTIQVQNLTGTAYQTVVGFPGRPRTILAGARLER